MKKIDIGEEVLDLHKKYIINDDKPKGVFPHSWQCDLSFNEAYQFRQAFMIAPRIGRVQNNRKKDDELVAVPRGLLIFLVDETRYGLYVLDLWMRGEMFRLSEERGPDD